MSQGAGADISRRKLLTELSEELYRQVHPKMIGDDGLPSSGAFVPSSNDAGELSVARSTLTTAKAAHDLHTLDFKLDSAGTWAVTVGEVVGAGLGSIGDPTDADEAKGEPADPAHAFVDYRGVGKNPMRRAALALKGFANSRGPRYSPETT